MTLQSPAWMQNGVTYSARTDRLANTDILFETPGVIRETDFRVTPSAPASMVLNISSGQAVVPGNRIVQQGHYTVTGIGADTVTVPTADTTNPRIDVLVLEVLDSEVAGTTDTARFRIISGQPSGTPSVPSVPPMAIQLAEIAVPRGAGTIVASNINNNKRHRATLHRSIGGGSAIPVANRQEANFLLAQFSGSINRSNPLVVYRKDAKEGEELEISTDGKTFSTVNPPEISTGWVTTFLNMRSGWKNRGSTSQTRIRRKGDDVQFALYMERTGGTISVPAGTGNVVNHVVCTLREPWRPNSWGYGLARERMAAFTLSSNGDVALTGVAGTAPIRKGDGFILHMQYKINW